MPENVILYGHPDSGHVWKIALALSLAHIDFESRFIDIWADPSTRPQEFLAKSPFAEVPLLTIGEESFFQSGAILLEIAERFSVLGGENPELMKRAREIILWEANRIGMCLPQLIEAERLGPTQFHPEARNWLKARFDLDIKRLTFLLGEKIFLLGDTPTIADCSVFGYVRWHEKAGVTLPSNIEAWLDRLKTRAHEARVFQRFSFQDTRS